MAVERDLDSSGNLRTESRSEGGDFRLEPHEPELNLPPTPPAFFLKRAGWHLRQRWRAALIRPGLTLATLTGVVTLLLPAYLEHFATRGLLPALSLGIATLLAVGVVSIYIGGSVSLRSLDPSTFAVVMLAGRPVDEMLSVVALRISQACHRFTKVARKVRELSLDLECHAETYSTQGYSATLQKDLNQRWDEVAVLRMLKRLHKLRLADHSVLQRLEAMKLLASLELGIPARRLCDHVFEYSPLVHRDRVRKYEYNWQEMRTTWDSVSNDTEVDRYVGLIVQNNAISADAWLRRARQKLLLRFPGLHTHVRDLASVHSTSGALQAYVLALATVPNRLISLGPNDWPRDLKDPRYREVVLQLGFLYRKRQAHPGFDLHTLLLRLLEELKKDYSQHEQGTSDESKLIFLLEGIRASRNRKGDPLLIDLIAGQNPQAEAETAQAASTELPGRTDSDIANQTEDGIVNTADVQEGPKADRRTDAAPDIAAADQAEKEEETAEEKVNRTRLTLSALATLPKVASQAIARSRAEIRRRFLPIYSSWFSETREHRFLVTHDYSKTVRNILKSPEWQKHLTNESLLFILTNRGEEELDARFLEYELKEGKKIRKERPLGTGDVTVLEGLVARGDSVMIVLGAECFDDRRTVVHSRGIAGRLDALRRQLVSQGVRVLVVVLAEQYKHQEGRLVDTTFFDDHYDRVDLYHPSDIDLVVSDRRTYPEDWRRVVDLGRARVRA